ncbi:MAG: hypothetical protein COA36_02360 [Desulfotalea sp.]|nr:MAG: hypothetical protein COA36_02360 [Desulfotalea sp.]
MGPFVYIVPSALKTKKLNTSLAGIPDYTIRDEKGERVEGVILDTFDNILLKRRLLLFGLEGGLVVLDLKEGCFVEQEIEGAWRFSSDLPAGPVAELLADVSPLRAFLTVAKVKIRQTKGVLLDDEGKTRARYTNLTVNHADSSISFGVVTSMRGYQRAFEDLIDIMGQAGAIALDNGSEIYRLLAIKRYNYTNKPELHLDADAVASETAARIISAFMLVARANESGVIGDYDTEFLHDYRVSFRKVRSVLSLFKGVYDGEITRQLKSEFSAIMQGTNRLRDLDVYLMEKDHYFTMVPEPSLAGLTLLFAYLANERKKELKKVKKILQSKAYERQVDSLNKLFMDSANLSLGPKGKLPSKLLASKLVLKRYSQVCRIAGTINRSTRDEVVHELRISCKKLRYLMEFFTPLYDQDGVRQIIKTLKVLQDNLGRFNDYSVQQTFLRQILDHELGSFKGDEMQLTEAIGALTAMLYSMQKKERTQVVKNFIHFNSEETRLLFKELFQKKGEA